MGRPKLSDEIKKQRLDAKAKAKAEKKKEKDSARRKRNTVTRTVLTPDNSNIIKIVINNRPDVPTEPRVKFLNKEPLQDDSLLRTPHVQHRITHPPPPPQAGTPSPPQAPPHVIPQAPPPPRAPPETPAETEEEKRIRQERSQKAREEAKLRSDEAKADMNKDKQPDHLDMLKQAVEARRKLKGLGRSIR